MINFYCGTPKPGGGIRFEGGIEPRPIPAFIFGTP
jgi:hypothetical protein